jgi:uncharacterized membrane protein YphA (DoxX/SURF4 family)
MNLQPGRDWKAVFVTVLRMAVGWHFLYEGVSKLLQKGWTASDYLANATGPLAGFYHSLAASPGLLKAVDLLNMYGLTAIGLALSLGILVRYASAAGALMLALYYFAYPPFGASLAMYNQPGIFIVNAQVIEAAVLLVFVFLRDTGYGIDRLIPGFLGKAGAADAPPAADGRRELLKNLATFPVLGLAGWAAARHKRTYGVDVVSGATIKIGAIDLSQLKGELPKGKIKDHEISRLVCGGNLIGGWAHSRDLLYASSLFKAYNTEPKIFETLMLAERAGINSINIGFPSNPLLQKYKKLTGSRIKVISQIAPGNEKEGLFVNIDKAIDHGVDIIQIQGNHGDWLVRDGKIDDIAKMLEHIRKQGYTAGLGAHSVETLFRTQEAGIIPDYYMKTMHHDRYWSAHPKENRIPFEVDGKRNPEHDKFHDNMWCLNPERTVEFAAQTRVPIMGFKVLAAGAIRPEDGFRWAFQNGADFICVGMFDFQVVKDVNVAIETLAKLKDRKREWYG